MAIDRVGDDTADASFQALVAAIYHASGGWPSAWQCVLPSPAEPYWISFRQPRAARPPQGWKLHISAGVATAHTIIRCVLPLLLRADADFKIAASLDLLQQLNTGTLGVSQVGKFITVYTPDEGQAVRLAVLLDGATQGMRGPRIPSDRPLAAGSLVHYRYGSYVRRIMQTPAGTVVPALLTSQGDLMPDRREREAAVPTWLVDPFQAAGLATPSPPLAPLVGGRYFITALLAQSVGGAVARAVDLVAVRPCIVKRAARHALMQRDGRDATDRLRHEYAILQQLGPVAGVPEVFDLLADDGDLFLIMEAIEGLPLAEYVADLRTRGQAVGSTQIITWGRQLAAILALLHDHGIVHGDVKSTNVLVTPAGDLRLIDFDIAYDRHAADLPYGMTTHGYASPQQAGGELPANADDLYSLGALLFFLATGLEPMLHPRPSALFAHGLHDAADIDPALRPVLARCLAADPAQRYPSMHVLGLVLARTHPAVPADRPVLDAGSAKPALDLLVSRLGTAVCGVVQRWLRSADPQQSPLPFFGPAGQARDLYDGSAGPLLALAELVATTPDPARRALLLAGAHCLMTAPRPAGPPVAGLYLGEAGVGAVLLRAAYLLDDAELLAAAEARGRLIAALPATSPDLITGLAGRLQFHLWLWDATAAAEHLAAARAAGIALLAAVHGGADERWWSMPAGYGEMSGRSYCGYAHGAAGIADALLDLFEATGEQRFLHAAQGAGRWLMRLAAPALADGSGLNWPRLPGEALSPCLWCHGATGIGRFFLHAARLEMLPDAARFATGAARTVARATASDAAAQCHGVAGSIELLLDMFRLTGEQHYLATAYEHVRTLELLYTDDALVPILAGFSETYSPAYMLGYPGVLVCLLRVRHPGARPHLLSRAGLRSRPDAAPPADC